MRAINQTGIKQAIQWVLKNNVSTEYNDCLCTRVIVSKHLTRKKKTKPENELVMAQDSVNADCERYGFTLYSCRTSIDILATPLLLHCLLIIAK